MKHSVEADIRRGFLRIGSLFNKVEVKIPEGHTCVAEGFHLHKGKVVRKGKIQISKVPNEDRMTRIQLRDLVVVG